VGSRRVDKALRQVASSSALLLRPLLGRVRRLISAKGITRRAYRKWIRKYELISPKLRAMMAGEIAAWSLRPTISVIMPSYNVDPKWMIQAIESVRNQIYPHWELCVSDDASTVAGIRPLLGRYAMLDSRINVTFRSENGHISLNSNSAIDLASGDYVALLDADDVLSEDAIYWAAREIALHPEADLLFSDEDKIDSKGRRFDPYFKSAWNPALMLSQNAFSHLGIYRRSIVEKVGRFRTGYEGSQDHDLVLRCAAVTTADKIRHIPRVLYHWRALSSSTASATTAKSYAWQAGRSAIADHLRCSGATADVSPSVGGYYQVEYAGPDLQPMVSVITPSTLSGSVVGACLHSVLTRSTYDNIEMLIVVRSDHLRAAKSDPDFAQLLADPRVRLIEYDGAFNFSKACNLGARSARGDLLCLLNDDVEVITPSWLEKLVARGALEGVGAVGPMLYYPNDTVQHAGVVLGAGGIADHAFKRRRRGYTGYFGRAALEQDYSCLTAACLLVKRTVFDDIGGFDESLPVAFNDVDLCVKIRRNGARIVWAPTVEMYHHESFTFGHHASLHRRDQFRHDVAVMRERWKNVLANDPCYNPNLSLARGAMFTLAWPPRLPSPNEILAAPTRISISRSSELPLKEP
jgi:O-antigen biosynthesis protein